jgi:hypothetical protein
MDESSQWAKSPGDEGMDQTLTQLTGLKSLKRGSKVRTSHPSKHSAAFIIDVMRTHPLMIIGGIQQENPFYVQPEEFVRELRAREAANQGSSAPAA